MTGKEDMNEFETIKAKFIKDIKETEVEAKISLSKMEKLRCAFEVTSCVEELREHLKDFDFDFQDEFKHIIIK